MADEEVPGRYLDKRPDAGRKKLDGVPLMTCEKCDSTFFEAVTLHQYREDNMVAPDRQAIVLSTVVRYKCGKCGTAQDHPQLNISEDRLRKAYDAFQRELAGESSEDAPFIDKFKSGQRNFQTQEEIVKARMEQEKNSRDY